MPPQRRRKPGGPGEPAGGGSKFWLAASKWNL
jgi:hypothetical protein